MAGVGAKVTPGVGGFEGGLRIGAFVTGVIGAEVGDDELRGLDVGATVTLGTSVGADVLTSLVGTTVDTGGFEGEDDGTAEILSPHDG